jgi:hypothetical protein
VGFFIGMKGNAMTDMLQEYCDSRGASMRVDARAGIIHGVKLLGLESRNGRTYLPEALAQAATLYEDAKVNVNHPKGNPTGPRDYQDRIGMIRGVVVRSGEGLFGDFHFNPKHALAEQLIWDAEHSPENVGFSHNVEARTSRRGDRVVVEAITRVQSVDLVADPATTRGLFESAGGEAVDSAGVQESNVQGDSPIFAETNIGTTPGPLTVDDLKRDYPELFESIVQEHAVELGRLQKEVERLTESETAHQKRDAARRLLREFDLPDPETSDPWAKTISGGLFFNLLLGARDEGAMREMVEERSRLVRRLSGASESRPQSRDQNAAIGVVPTDTKSFVEAIT